MIAAAKHRKAKVDHDVPCRACCLAADALYQPQHDSRLLVDTMRRTVLIRERRVLDLCTGGGVVAIAAAELGAPGVTAFDICPPAVRCSRGNADVREGSWTGAFGYAPFEVIVSNPPYVPAPPTDDAEQIPSAAGPSWALECRPRWAAVTGPVVRIRVKTAV